jgi:hypothetical protein
MDNRAGVEAWARGGRGPLAVAIAHPVDEVCERDLLEKLFKQVPEKDIPTLSWLARYWLHGEKLAAIANEANVDYDVAYKRVMALQRRLQKSATVLAGLALIVLLIGSIYARSQVPVATPDKPVLTQLPAGDPSEMPEMMKAARLREGAWEKCYAAEPKWLDCLGDLEAARDLDPEGDDTPRVRQMRADLGRAIQEQHEELRKWNPKTGRRR